MVTFWHLLQPERLPSHCLVRKWPFCSSEWDHLWKKCFFTSYSSLAIVGMGWNDREITNVSCISEPACWWPIGHIYLKFIICFKYLRRIISLEGSLDKEVQGQLVLSFSSKLCDETQKHETNLNRSRYAR